MKFKENAGTDPVSLSRGFTALDGDPPHSGESITHPEHVAEERRMERMRKELGFPGTDNQDDGPEGFLERETPSSYLRPSRSAREDRG